MCVSKEKTMPVVRLFDFVIITIATVIIITRALGEGIPVPWHETISKWESSDYFSL